ncbi:hypothetical protein V8C37DRAFT_394734 [Trichoderma ceciliae]
MPIDSLVSHLASKWVCENRTLAPARKLVGKYRGACTPQPARSSSQWSFWLAKPCKQVSGTGQPSRPRRRLCYLESATFTIRTTARASTSQRPSHIPDCHVACDATFVLSTPLLVACRTNDPWLVQCRISQPGSTPQAFAHLAAILLAATNAPGSTLCSYALVRSY